MDEYNSMSLNEQLHYPNFGKALEKIYDDLGAGTFIKDPEPNVPNGQQFRGWFDWVKTKRIP
jgi:hypothetical protein